MSVVAVHCAACGETWCDCPDLQFAGLTPIVRAADAIGSSDKPATASLTLQPVAGTSHHFVAHAAIANDIGDQDHA